MNDFAPILLVLLVGVVGYAVVLWKKLAKAEQFLRAETQTLDEKRQEIEKVRKEVRERATELEHTKKLLTEAKNKQKRQDRPPPKEGAKKGRDNQEDVPSAIAAVVHVSDQELAAQHRRVVEKLERDLEDARAELDAMKKREAERQAETARALKSLENAAAANEAKAEAVAETRKSSDEEVAALRTQIEALKRASVEREKDLRSELRRAQDSIGHERRRASNHQQLYQVIKGQLELTEDRLAALRRKYEGAKTPEELKREQRKKEAREQRRAREQARPAASENGAHAEEAAEPAIAGEESIAGEAPAVAESPASEAPAVAESARSEAPAAAEESSEIAATDAPSAS
jgi:hypothetical protein